MKENIQMSIKEAERLGIMKRIDKKILTIRKALGISEGQTKRIKKRYSSKTSERLYHKKSKEKLEVVA